MIEAAALAQYGYLKAQPDVKRKPLGQYFTEAPVADYMASMIEPSVAGRVRILDAGAGVGMLTLSAALRCLAMGQRQVQAILYEIDGAAIAPLTANMRQLANAFRQQGGQFMFEVRHEDFILSRPDRTEAPFHLSLINPPYFKYNAKTSPYADATADLFKGNPNIYASFMAVVAACLAPNGQMVAIVPRSFTNGLYFKGFRHYLFQNLSLEKLHSFRSRDQLFKALSVLQENIICSYRKGCQSTRIKVGTSAGCNDLNQVKVRSYSAKLLLDTTNEHCFIRIPESAEQAATLQTVARWPSSFQENGYFISTGPVVEHRTQEYITTAKHKVGSVPLLRLHNVKAFKTLWSGDHKKDVRFRLVNNHDKHTSDNQFYVILKRFSSKDEKRRLVAAVHDPQTMTGNRIAFENHLNYLGHCEGALNRAEAYGLAALFNSTFMDQYFRCLSGSTQVNATEVRLLKLPTREVIQRIGAVFLEQAQTEQQHIDSLVNRYLDVKVSAVA